MPGFNPFRSHRKNSMLFDVRLESDVIVLRGHESGAASQVLRGVVALCLPSALDIEYVHLQMTGQCKIRYLKIDPLEFGVKLMAIGRRWHELKTSTLHLCSTPNFERILAGSPSKTITIPAGNHMWPFEFVIPGSTVESIEGLDDAKFVYKLKAIVVRERLSHDLHAHKPVHVIRIPDPLDLQFPQTFTLQRVWQNKVEYSLTIPQPVRLGTSIQIHLTFASLLKGLQVGIVQCGLLELHDWMFDHPNLGCRHWKKSRDIASWEFDVSEREHSQDYWELEETLLLPKSIRRCTQDVDTMGISIHHMFQFNITLKNPDGHISEIRGSLPISIIIISDIPTDDSGNLVAPPLYGEHLVDQLYAESTSQYHPGSGLEYTDFDPESEPFHTDAQTLPTYEATMSSG